MKLRLATALLATTAFSAWAAPAAAQRAPATQLDEIVVVGSSIKTTEAEIVRAPTPIQVVTQEKIELSGKQTVGELLRTQPAFTGTSQSAEGAGFGRSTLNLRGLGDQYTLSLLNGRRFAVNGAANVAIVPTEAIQRVEVLTNGASAIYGSDAVAGVVNLVLKREGDGISLSSRYGSGTGALEERQYSASLGGHGENGGYIFAVDYFQREGLRAKSLPTGTNNLAPFGSFDFRSNATNPTRFTLPDGRDLILNTDTVRAGSFSVNPANYRTYVRDRDAWDRVDGGIYAISPTYRTSVLFSGYRDLSPDTKLSLDVLGNRTYDKYLVGSSIAVVTVPGTNPYNPFGVPVVATYRFNDFSNGPYNKGIGALQQFKIDTITSAATLDHRFSDRLSLQATANYYREESHENRPNAYSMQGFLDALGRTGADAFNPFCDRCNTPAQQAGVLVGAYIDRTSELLDGDIRLTGTLWDLPGGSVNFAIGAAYRKERFTISSDPLFAQGGLVDQGVVTPEGLSRDVSSLFAEVRAPLFKNFELQAAARYEHYSDFGGTFNPLIAVKWNVVPDWVTLRASYSTSFRAPFLQDLTASRDSSQVTVTDPSANNATVGAVAITGGNPNLSSEDAETFSVGAVISPQAIPGLFATLDVFHIEQSNLVISPSPQAVISGLAPGKVTRGFNAGGAGRNVLIEATKVNGGDRKVTGVDFSASYKWNVADDASITFDVSGTRLIKYKVDSRDGAGFVDYAGEYNATYGGLPRWKVNFGPTLRYKWFTGNLTVRHAGGYTDPEFFGLPAEKISAKNYIDVAARADLGRDGLDLIPGGEFQIGATNLGNIKTPFVRASSLFFDGLPWDRGNFDVAGRFVYGKLGVRF